jgi:hypothetical protein
MLIGDRSPEGVDGQLMYGRRGLPLRALHLFGVTPVNQGEGVLHTGALMMPSWVIK